MKSKVYFTKEITSDSLIKIYEALNVDLKGNVGIKLSTGEAGSKGYLKADLIEPFVKKLKRISKNFPYLYQYLALITILMTYLKKLKNTEVSTISEIQATI